ncbi:MAG: hypothetical protein JRC86_13150 [Deltaproteobacteria bacterium]|nr:hypothetical protein [Deltaproteobacteria bacterium]
MNPEDVEKMGRVALVFARSVAASAEIESMKAANQYGETNGIGPQYTAQDFAEVADRFNIGENAVTSTICGG